MVVFLIKFCLGIMEIYIDKFVHISEVLWLSGYIYPYIVIIMDNLFFSFMVINVLILWIKYGYQNQFIDFKN